MIFKALSVRQPWAWALLHGKPVENRTWAPRYRGILLIHASLKFDNEGFAWIKEHCEHLPLDADLPDRKGYLTGGIIGAVTLTDIVENHDSPFFFGPKGLVCKDPLKIPFYRIPGKLGIFDVKMPNQYKKYMKSIVEWN